MRLRVITVRAGEPCVLDESPEPSGAWCEDESVRVLFIEGSREDQLAQLVDRLGIEGASVAAHIHGPDWIQPLEQESFSLTALPEPTVWMESRTWFHILFRPGMLVTVHRAETPHVGVFIQNRMLDRPAPEATLQDVLMFTMEGLTMDENAEFARIRFEVEQHAKLLKESPETARIEQLEDLMTRTHHMATVFFEMQRLCENLEFSRARSSSSVGTANSSVLRPSP